MDSLRVLRSPPCTSFFRLRLEDSHGYTVSLHNTFTVSASVHSTSTKENQKRPPQRNKPSRLLRTWTEGRKIHSNSSFPKPQLEQDTTPELKDSELPAYEEGESLDTFYLHDGGISEDEDSDWKGNRDASYPSISYVENEVLSGLDSQSMDLKCEHFKRCSGCVIETALDQPQNFKDAQRFFCCHGIEDLELVTGSVWEWRCKAKLAVRGTSENPSVGLYVEGTHDVVDIPNCRTHHPRINAAIELLKSGIRELGVQPYNEDTGTGELRYIQMSVTTYNTSIPIKERYLNGRVQVVLVWNARSEQSSSAPLLSSLAQFLCQKGGAKSADSLIHSVWANFQTSRSNVIFGGRWRHLLGEQQCWERIGGVDVTLTPASFSQANLQAFESLLRKLQKFVKPGNTVVELYAGSGIIGLSLAANCGCRAVRCVEVNKEAKTSFDLSLSRFRSSKTHTAKISWHCADVTVSTINWLKGADIVVVDPPRKGLDKSVIEALRLASYRGQGDGKTKSEKEPGKVEKRPWILRAQVASIEAASQLNENESSWPETLIYISCGWESFKRDCMDLVEDGAWHLSSGQTFNFFPGTNSIEVLAVFKRGKKQDKKTSKNKDTKTNKTKNSMIERRVSKRAK